MEQVLQVNVIAVTFVASWLIPLAVGLLTKSSASSSVKAVLNLGLTVATGVCTCLITAKGTVTVGQLTTAVMTAFTGSGLSYTHLWKPTGAAASVQSVAPAFGLGAQKVLDVPAPVVTEPVDLEPKTLEQAQTLAGTSLLTGASFLVLVTPVITSEGD